MKTLYLALMIICLALIASGQTIKTRSDALDETTLSALKNKKAAIDKYLKKNPKALTVLVKVPGKKSLVKVEGDKWPDEIEYTYNIVKDATGKIILIAQIPYSESGDWFITYSHYFDEQGKTFAFVKKTNVFSEEIKGGVVYETDTKYYDADCNVIKQTHTLLDKNSKAVKNGQNIDIYRYQYSIFKDVATCISGYRITRLK